MGKVTIGSNIPEVSAELIQADEILPFISDIPSIDIQQLLNDHKEEILKNVNEKLQPQVMPLDPIEKRLLQLEESFKNLPPTRHTKIIDEYNDTELREMIKGISDMKIPTLMVRNTELNIKFEQLTENIQNLIRKNKELSDKIELLENLPVSETKVVEIKRAAPISLWVTVIGLSIISTIIGIIF